MACNPLNYAGVKGDVVITIEAPSGGGKTIISNEIIRMFEEAGSFSINRSIWPTRDVLLIRKVEPVVADQKLSDLIEEAKKLRKAFAVVGGESSPFCRIALAQIDNAISKAEGGA